MRAYMLVAWLLGVGALAADTQRFSFDEDPAGKAPAGLIAATTGQGAEGAWIVEKAPDAQSAPNVVRQSSTDDTSYRFPVLVAAGVQATDGALSVRFKAISGRVDQAAGLVWRYADENNYYVVRANALENNVVLYKMEEGKRSSLAPVGTPARTYGVDHEVPRGEWSTLSLRFEGPRFTVSFNGEELFQVEDGTFSGAGGVGIWTRPIR